MIHRVLQVACCVPGGGIRTGVIVALKHIDRGTPALSMVLISSIDNSGLGQTDPARVGLIMVALL